MQRRNRRATRQRFQAMRIRATSQRRGYPSSGRAAWFLREALERIDAPEDREELMLRLTAIQTVLEARRSAL